MKILDNTGREDWLEQRRGLITATDVARLFTGGFSTWQTLREEKTTGGQMFDSPAMAWGREREPAIAAVVGFTRPGLVPNDRLVVDDSGWRAATPDMLVVDDGRVVGGAELKTVRQGRCVGWEDGEIPTRYMCQVQWQMLVCGVDEWLFAWEPYDDQQTPWAPGKVHVISIPRDEALQAELVALAEQFREDAPSDDSGVEALVGEYVQLQEQERVLKERKAALQAEILAACGNKPAKLVGQWGSLSITERAPAARFDAKAFRQAHPDMAEQFTVSSSKTPQLVLRVTPRKDN